MSEEQNQQTTQEETKPVYKASTGIPSVDDYREAESHNFKAEENEAQVEPQTQTVQNENTTASDNDNTPPEENASSFTMPSLDGEAEGEANSASAVIADWKEELKKANPKDDDGTFYIIQARFAIEEEMCLWATSKMMNRLQKQQTAKVTCIQETMVN